VFGRSVVADFGWFNSVLWERRSWNKRECDLQEQCCVVSFVACLVFQHSERRMQMLGEKSLAFSAQRDKGACSVKKLQCTVSTLPDRSSLSEQLFLLLIVSPPNLSSGQASSQPHSSLVIRAGMSKLGGKKENWNKILELKERMKGGGRLGKLTDAVGVELWVFEVQPFLHHSLGLWPRRRLHERTGEGRPISVKTQKASY